MNDLGHPETWPYVIDTCEGNPYGPKPLSPQQDRPFAPFPINDPFGLRNAIVPVFSQSSTGKIIGMGTAFHIDGLGTFATAHHVIEFAENDRKQRPLLLLGMNGVIYGSVAIPGHRLAPATKFAACKIESADPLHALRGGRSYDAIDVAVLTIELPTTKPPHTVPLRTRGWAPKPGEILLAVGFPKLDATPLDLEEQRALLEEGMCGAYGRIVAVHPSGTSKSNPSPVLEVESDWPPGMSGGPVFNCKGEVVGIVSRSLRAGPDHAGTGFAVDLRIAPDMERLAPTLDADNPGWRRCWATFSPNVDTPSSFHSTAEDAERIAASTGRSVREGSNRIGSTGWIEAG